MQSKFIWQRPVILLATLLALLSLAVAGVGSPVFGASVASSVITLTGPNNEVEGIANTSLGIASQRSEQAATTTAIIKICSQGSGTWDIFGSAAVILRTKLDAPGNFGPTGVYGDYDFQYVNVGNNVTEQVLITSGCNIWFSGYESDSSYTVTELNELENWVASQNGQVIAGCDDSSHDPVCDRLGFTVTTDTDTYGFIAPSLLVNPINCDGTLGPGSQLEMSGGAGGYFSGPAVSPNNTLALHETSGVPDPAKPIVVYTGNFFLTADVNMIESPTLSSGTGVVNPNDILAMNAFSALADVSQGKAPCSSAAAVTHTLTVVTQGVGSGIVTSTPGGINCGADCSEDYPEFTAVTLNVVLDANSILSSWSGDCNANGEVAMDADKTCTATIATLNTPPAADAGDPYSGDEGSAIALSDASASDGDGDSLTYNWTVDSGLCSFDDASALNPNLTCTDNGSFVATLTVDDGTETASDTAAVTVDNVAPTATFGNDGPVDEGDDFTLSLTSPTDPGADTFTYAFDCGDGSGYSTASASSSATCATTAPGVRAVKGKIIDDDGGETEYTNSVTVTDVPPFLDIPDDLTGNQGQTVEVPVNLTANGDQISALAFTLGFVAQCLDFDTTDSNNDGLPDAVVLNQATGFQLGVNIDNAGQGSLGLVVSPEASTPPLPTFSNGAVATVTFTILCGDESTALTLSNASFGNDQGASVSGQTDGGTIDINRPPVAVDDVRKTTPGQAVTIDVLANDTDVDNDTLTVITVLNGTNGNSAIQGNQVVYTPNPGFLGLDSFEYTISDGNLTDVGTVQVAVGIRGDANADVTVDAGDLPAVVLEILDVDGNNWLDTLGGTFLGNPVGTDSNEDESITAGDLSCTVRLLLFGVEDRCAPEQRSGAKAILGLPASVAVQNGTVQVPIRYTTNGNQAAALALALEIDAEQVTFDSADNDGNGLPDGLQLNLASGFQAMAIYKDSLLNLVIFSAELKALPDGVVATLSLAVESQTGDGPALRFSQSQPASLGGVDGAAIPVQIDNDAVTGLDQPVFQHQIFLPALGR